MNTLFLLVMLISHGDWKEPLQRTDLVKSPQAAAIYFYTEQKVDRLKLGVRWTAKLYEVNLEAKWIREIPLPEIQFRVKP